MNHDPRLTPARSDIAAEHLRGVVAAPTYVTGEVHRVTTRIADLRRVPGGGLDTQLLHGEDFTVYHVSDGWAWGQAATDGYVGYVEASSLVEPGPEPTHTVLTLGAHVYRVPELKLVPVGQYPFGARLHVADATNTHAQVGSASWVPLAQLTPLSTPARDWVGVAERLLGVPYVWGGRSSDGLDCSGLVQLALQAAHRPAPRDSDHQQAALGRTLPPGEPACRGDLVFWKGHVGVMRDSQTLLHANAHHMAVSSEPLDEALHRIGANEFGEVVRRARLDPET